MSRQGTCKRKGRNRVKFNQIKVYLNQLKLEKRNNLQDMFNAMSVAKIFSDFWFHKYKLAWHWQATNGFYVMTNRNWKSVIERRNLQSLENLIEFKRSLLLDSLKWQMFYVSVKFPKYFGPWRQQSTSTSACVTVTLVYKQSGLLRWFAGTTIAITTIAWQDKL